MGFVNHIPCADPFELMKKSSSPDPSNTRSGVTVNAKLHKQHGLM
jgi:hypothetical protein